jgi:hypothetical protein
MFVDWIVKNSKKGVRLGRRVVYDVERLRNAWLAVTCRRHTESDEAERRAAVPLVSVIFAGAPGHLHVH